MNFRVEKRALQVTMAIACLVPIGVGLSGMLTGVALLGGGALPLDSHFRYLSGLLLGIGLGFVTAIPGIEYYGERVRLLTGLVVIGGFARLYGLIVAGVPDASMQFGLGMELVVTPLLCLWQWRIAQRALRENTSDIV